MASPSYSIIWSAQSLSAAQRSVGDCVVYSGSAFVLATTANRGGKRSTGIVVTAGTDAVEIQTIGRLTALQTGLAAGTAAPLRVSATGFLERVATPTNGDDLVGYCETDGSAHVWFGGIYDAMQAGIAGGSFVAGGDLSGTDSNQTVDAIQGVAISGTPAAGSVLRATGASAAAWGAVDLADTDAVTGVLPVANIASGSGANNHVVKVNSGGTAVERGLIANANVDTNAGIAVTKLAAGSANTVLRGDGSANAFGAVTNAYVDAAAAIAVTKLAAGSANTVLCGGASNSFRTIVNADVSASAAVDYSKLGAGSQSVGAQQFSSTVDTKGTDVAVLPKSVGTTNATVTTLDSFTLAADTAVVWTVVVAAIRDDESQAAFYVRTAGFRKAGVGAPAQVGTTQDGLTLEDNAAWDCTIDVSGNDIRCRVTGAALTNIRWAIVSERLEVVY
jgi:hypothetical protein